MVPPTKRNPPLQLLAHPLGDLRGGRQLAQRLDVTLDRTAVHEVPQERHRVVELEPRPGVSDGGRDLGPVAHDAGIREQTLDVVVVERSDGDGVEARERRSVPLRFEDGAPGQPGLRALEGQELEQHPLVALGHAPLVVVVGQDQRMPEGPLAPDRFVPAR